jgi:coenzyme F420-reducing hydrogenase delta subunit
MGAQGVFIVGCGEQCARENTTAWVYQRIEKVRKALEQIGLGPERLQAFFPGAKGEDIIGELDRFAEQIGITYLASLLMQETMQEVKK